MEVMMCLAAQAMGALLTALAGGAFGCALAAKKGLSRLEAETERALENLRREIETLGAVSPEADEEEEQKARRAERLFTEGLSNILGYDLGENERA